MDTAKFEKFSHKCTKKLPGEIANILKKSIKQIPDEVFYKYNFKREDILFFATMSDGDYMQEMLDASIKMFNTLETLGLYGLMY